MTSVSVIIPCYNVETYLPACIKSVIDQKFEVTEIICINNNSTDGTQQKLEELSAQYPGQLTLLSETKTGASAARNAGLRIARGEWIQFLDADDLLLPEKINHQVQLLEKESGISFIAASCIHRDAAGKEKVSAALLNNIFIAPFLTRCGNTCSNLWKKSDLLEVGGWNEKLASSQETDLMLRLALKNKKYICDEKPLTIICQRPTGQISQGNAAQRLERYINIRLEYLQTLKTLFPEQYNAHLPLFFDFIVVSLLELSKYNKKRAGQIFNTSIKPFWSTGKNFGITSFKYFILKRFGLISI